MKQSQTVFVGLSGGVDSSVAALRLKNAGYDVVGVFIKVWHPPFLECDWESERLDAMRVAAHLDIPFLTCDAVEAYKQDVADHFIAEYSAGRTPNPDVLCNKAVKFGRFIDFAKEHGVDLIATGHYAQIQQSDTGRQLLRGVDTEKDQTYFLWTLTQQQLAHVIFPVGDTPKSQIRREAEAVGLPVAAKKDSQGICFLGHIDIPEFLSHYVELTPGDVLNKNGQCIGEHRGALVYTRGQRHGFTISTHTTRTERYYIVERDISKNTITVDTKKPSMVPEDAISLHAMNWISDRAIATKEYHAQFRYRQKPFLITISLQSDERAIVKVHDAVDDPAPGQSCVFYDGDTCLGGGIIA